MNRMLSSKINTFRSKDHREAFKIFNEIRDLYNNFELANSFSKITTRQQGLELIDLIIKRRTELKESDEAEVMERLKPLFSKIKDKFFSKLSSFSPRHPSKNKTVKKAFNKKSVSNSHTTLKHSNTKRSEGLSRIQSMKLISTGSIEMPLHQDNNGNGLKCNNRRSKVSVLKTFLKGKSHSPKNRLQAKDSVNRNLKQRLIGSTIDINLNSEESTGFNKKANYFDSINEEFRQYQNEKKSKFHRKSYSMTSYPEKLENLKALEKEILDSIIHDKRRMFSVEMPEILETKYSSLTPENKLFSKVDKSVKGQFSKHIETFKQSEHRDYFAMSLRRFSGVLKPRKTTLFGDTPMAKEESPVKEKIKVPMYIQTGMGYKKYYRYPKARNRKEKFVSVDDVKRIGEIDTNNSFASYTEQKLDNYYRTSKSIKDLLKKQEVRFQLDESPSNHDDNRLFKKKQKELLEFSKKSVKMSNFKLFTKF